MPSLPDKLKDPPSAPFFWGGNAWDWFTKSLQFIYLAVRAQQPPAQEDILKALATINTTLEKLMATVAELQSALDANTAATEAAVASITTEIAQLQAAIDALAAAAGPDLQPQVDQVAAATARLQTAVDALNADDTAV